MLDRPHSSLGGLLQSHRALVWQFFRLVAYGSVGMLMYCLAPDQTCKGSYSFCLPKFTTLCHELITPTRPTMNKDPDSSLPEGEEVCKYTR